MSHYASILILAGAVFFYGHEGSGKDAASLFDAYDVIRDFVGKRTSLSQHLLMIYLHALQRRRHCLR